jgi:hypothetical protein
MNRIVVHFPLLVKWPAVREPLDAGTGRAGGGSAVRRADCSCHSAAFVLHLRVSRVDRELIRLRYADSVRRDAVVR